MIKVVGAGTPEERIRRLEHSVNFSEVVLPFALVGSMESVDAVPPALGINLYGSCTVDRTVFRERLQDDRWLLYAAGFAAGAGNTLALQLAYLDDAAGITGLGSATIITVAGWAKYTIGPLDLFALAPVSKTETVPVIVLSGQSIGGATQIAHWTLWVRYLASKV